MINEQQMMRANPAVSPPHPFLLMDGFVFFVNQTLLYFIICY